MINELHSLGIALKNGKIRPVNEARQYLPLPNSSLKKPCFKICLQNNGKVKEIENLSTELVKTLRKFGDNQGTFPAFNIIPLYQIKDIEIWKLIEKMKTGSLDFDLETIKVWCVEDNWKNNTLNNLKNCFFNKGTAIGEIIEKYGEGKGKAILKLLSILNIYKEEKIYDFRTNLEECIYENLQKQEDIKSTFSMLFSKKTDGNKQAELDNLSVILDLYDRDEFENPIASAALTKEVNKILVDYEVAKFGNDNLDTKTLSEDAFGCMYKEISEPMPKVKLVGFDVSIRTMFSEHQCQYRYGTIEGSSYPISYENRSQVKNALVWISQEKFKDRMWIKTDKDEIVYAYPSKSPNVSLKYISFLGKTNDSSFMNEDLFRSVSADFIKTFKGLQPEEKPDYIHIFTLRKLDKAKTKVMYTRNCAPENYIDAASDWIRGCDNVPALNYVKHSIPFPLEFADIVNIVWKQNGELANSKKPKIKRMEYYEGLELLLNTDAIDNARNLLNVLLTNSSGLVQFIGNQSSNKKSIDPKKLEEINKVVSAFGLLLYKCSRRKDTFMEDTAYLLGQLLKVSDELHELYCRVVRDDNVPPQLVGSSLFTSACEMPIQTLAQLGMRINPYITWAKHYRAKNVNEGNLKSVFAARYLMLYEQISEKLHGVLQKPVRFNDYDKAELFLGYLASLPKKEKLIESADSAEIKINN